MKSLIFVLLSGVLVALAGCADTEDADADKGSVDRPTGEDEVVARTMDVSGLRCGFNTSGGGDFTVKGAAGGRISSNAYYEGGIVQRRSPRLDYLVTALDVGPERIALTAKAIGPNLYMRDERMDFTRIEIRIDRKRPMFTRGTFRNGGSEFNAMLFDCDASDFEHVRRMP